MNMFHLLEVSPVAETTTSGAIFYDGSVVGWTLDQIIFMIRDFVILLRGFKIYKSVSYFDFFIALAVMSIVIVYLVNIARTPRVETSRSSYSRKNRKDNSNAKK